jgi:probable biosynthetic protein (TIGR04098 family)
VRLDWNDDAFTVAMPHLAPGDKLSEVEFLKRLGTCQWDAIARVLGRPSQEITSEFHERLYASWIDVELKFGARHAPDRFAEGARIRVRNRVRVFARRFVEGFFVFGDEEVPDAVLQATKTREDLRALGSPWCYMTNAFIAPVGGNTRLKVFQPAGIEDLDLPEAERTPPGIEDHARVQATGRIDDLGEGDPGVPLPVRDPSPIPYPLVPESDVNGAGLVYFARYVAIMNYGERRFLSERIAPPLSQPLATCLSTEHRRIYYFANAAPTDTVEIAVSARLVPPGRFPAPDAGARIRTPLKLIFRIDMVRGSDKVLMASSLVRKALNVPGDAKAVRLEADRFLAALAV